MTASDQLPGGLELWGGIECTVNRVGDTYYDQMEVCGHAARIEDLDLFADLGIKALRYPVLWERVAPGGIEAADWSWTDSRLNHLRTLGIEPIVGLVHHGSGPRHTCMDKASFATGLADFAGAVARRYPWIRYYTPVNEPLTTARFSGLYGHWYPHGTDAQTFIRCLLNQCKAVSLAMRAIREVNSEAQLVQTDDLGKTFSTPLLSYQADFENERRWVTWDLLCGRVNRRHAMWHYIRWAGASAEDLHWFLDNPCPPDIIGVNHYLTSERYLDHRVERYPEAARGGNGRHAYADVEAVRVLADGPDGPQELLEETWNRYRIPVAVTEAHLGCTREEQMRWLLEVWNGAKALRKRGADIRAVTAWSLLGAHDWNSLLTRFEGWYEPGVFDVRGERRRPTALAALAKELATGVEPRHPVLALPGWWRRPERILYPPAGKTRQGTRRLAAKTAIPKDAARPILITGATGTLGRAFARICEQRGLPYQLLNRREMDIADLSSVHAAVEQIEPWAVINTAGYVRVDDAETDSAACMRENAEGPALLASVCATREIALLTYSSDHVFHADQIRPFVESDPASPRSVYGRSKAESERRVLEAMPNALVLRTSAFFGPWDEYNFLTVGLSALVEGREFHAAEDSFISPTYVPDLVQASLDLLLDGERGIRHLSNEGAVSWAEFLRRAALAAGISTDGIRPIKQADMNLAAPRPAYSVLGTELGQVMPRLDDAVGRYVRDCTRGWASARAANIPLAVRERLTAEGLRGERVGSPSRAHGGPRRTAGVKSRASK